MSGERSADIATVLHAKPDCPFLFLFHFAFLFYNFLMADFPQMKLQQRISQNMTQTQTQKMSQSQIMSLNILNMSSLELRNEIYEKASKNPAIEITEDDFETGVKKAFENGSGHFSDEFHYGKASKAQLDASDNFQAALESNADSRESLSDHLEHQINAMNLSQEETELCKKLIYNLNEKGFHILSPSALLSSGETEEGIKLLKKCMNIVQRLDPTGTCTANFEESLYVQAVAAGYTDRCTLFLLRHFDFLNPPQPQKILKKIKAFFSQQEKLKFNSFKPFDCDEDTILNSLSLIKKLDPYPARSFSTSQTVYVVPDVKIQKNSDENGEVFFEVIPNFRIIPRISIAKDYESLVSRIKVKDGDTSDQGEKLKAELKFARDSIADAKSFIESIEYRENTVVKACRIIAEVQKAFFEKGPGNLVPLRQKDVAESAGVHEATISRMASAKYIECSWGIFPVSYFFSSAAVKKGGEESTENSGQKSEDGSSVQQPMSKEAVKEAVKKLLEEHKNGSKALSDQKLSELLAQQGIKIARRTVAKYRSELNVSSSYQR